MRQPDTKFSATPRGNIVLLPPGFTHQPDGTVDVRPQPLPTLSDHGLPPGQDFASIKGDPSLHETAPDRNRYVSRIDRKISLILDICEWLLTSTDSHSVYLGFNSSEVRTESVLHPFSYEIHDADRLIDEDYLLSHFTQIPFDAKMDAISWVQNRINEGPMRRYYVGPGGSRPDTNAHLACPALSPSLICDIVHQLPRLREVDDYYLRNAAISLGQGIVRATFNCDGTYVIPFSNFNDFVARYFDTPH